MTGTTLLNKRFNWILGQKEANQEGEGGCRGRTEVGRRRG